LCRRRRRAGQFWSAAAARRRLKKIGGGGAAWAVKFSNLAYLFRKFFSKELLLSRYAHVEQLLFAVV